MGTDIKASEFDAFAAELVRDLETVSLREELDKCVDEVHEGIGRNFDSKSGPEGQSWPPRKDRKKHPLLLKSHALYGAATGQGAGAVVEVEDRKAAVGVDSSNAGIIYALRQQFGFTGTDKLGRNVNHPPRPFIGASDPTIDNCAEIMADGVLDKVFNG